jgi:hypothetical protein
MPSVGIEPANSAGERPQTYVLDGAASGTGFENCSPANILEENPSYEGCFVQLRKMNWILHKLLLVTISNAVITAALSMFHLQKPDSLFSRISAARRCVYTY